MHDCAPLTKSDFVYDGTDIIYHSAKCVLFSLQFLSPDTDLQLRELIMDDEEILKTLKTVGFRGVPTSITLEARMDIIR